MVVLLLVLLFTFMSAFRVHALELVGERVRVNCIFLIGSPSRVLCEIKREW